MVVVVCARVEVAHPSLAAFWSTLAGSEDVRDLAPSPDAAPTFPPFAFIATLPLPVLSDSAVQPVSTRKLVEF